MIDPDDEFEYRADIQRKQSEEWRVVRWTVAGIFACAIAFWFVVGFVQYFLS